jgi:hypothetical protein
MYCTFRRTLPAVASPSVFANVIRIGSPDEFRKPVTARAVLAGDLMLVEVK